MTAIMDRLVELSVLDVQGARPKCATADIGVEGSS
jgi:hypothetical protein